MTAAIPQLPAQGIDPRIAPILAQLMSGKAAAPAPPAGALPAANAAPLARMMQPPPPGAAPAPPSLNPEAANPAQSKPVQPVRSAQDLNSALSQVAPAPKAGQSPTDQALSGDLSHNLNDLTAKEQQGSGISQIKNKWLRGLAMAGEIAGNVLAPGLNAAIPGTGAHHQLLLGNLEKRVGRDLGMQKSIADTNLANSKPEMAQDKLDQAARKQQETETNDAAKIQAAYLKGGYDENGTPLPHERLSEPVATKDTLNQAQTMKAQSSRGKYQQTDQGLMYMTTGADGTPHAQPVAGPDGKPLKGHEIGKTEMQEWMSEHSGSSVDDYVRATQKPGYPRFYIVHDAQGNTSGVNYIESMPGGGVRQQFIPAGAGGAPTVNGAIPANPTGTTLTMKQMAGMTHEQVPKLQQEVTTIANKLGPASGRWNDYMVGKIGADDPDFAGLKEDLKLYASAVVRTHFGGRSAEKYIDAMERDFTAAQSPADLHTRIAHADQWIRGYAQGAGIPGSAPASSGGGEADVAAPKFVSQSQLQAVAKAKYGGDIAKATAAAKKEGYTIQ